jgi:hypothetical protein
MKSGRLRRLLQLDPRSFSIIWACWCLVVALMLLGPGHVFDRAPTFHFVEKLGVSAWMMGLVMLADAAALVAVVLCDRSRCAAWVFFANIVFWLFIGSVTTLSAIYGGFLSSFGLFSLLGGLKFILAAAQLGARGA